MIPIRCRFLGFLLILTLVVGFTNGRARVARALASGFNTWTAVAPLPETRMNPTAASSDGRLYVFGGFCDTGPCGHAESYDPKSNGWTSMGLMPHVLRGIVSATTGADGRIYIYGWADPPAPPPSGATPPPAPPPSMPGPGATEAGGIVLIYDPRADTWSAADPPPGVDDSPSLVTGLDGRIYAVGGRVSGTPVGTLSAYNPTTRTWSSLKPFPTPRQSPGVTVGPDGRIYVIGGYEIGTGSAARADRVEAYDPRTNTWAAVAALPTPRGELQAVTGPDGRIYAIGGGAGSRCLTTPCAVVEAYDIKTNTWTSVAPLPHPRWLFAAAVGPDGRIYVLGGSKAVMSMPPNSLLAAVDAYTVVPGDQPLPRPKPGPTPVARELAPMPTGREGLAAVTSNGKIYAIGGQSVPARQMGPQSPGVPPEVPTVLRTVEAYDPGTNTWSAAPPLPVRLVGMGATTALDGRIYVLGGAAGAWNRFTGITGVVGLRSVEIYDPKTRHWSNGTPMPEGRFAFAAVTGKDGRIYTIGGATVCYPSATAATESKSPQQPARLPAQTPGGNCEGAQTVRAFDPRTNRWSMLAPLPDAGVLPAVVAGGDGRIYVFSGNINRLPTRSFHVYDPRTNRWTRLSGMLHIRFNGFVAAATGDGRIDLIGGCVVTAVSSHGGFSSNCGAPSPVDSYNPRTNSWQKLGAMLNVRIAPAVATGPDGRVYVVGGSGDGEGKLLEVIPSSRRK